MLNNVTTIGILGLTVSLIGCADSDPAHVDIQAEADRPAKKKNPSMTDVEKPEFSLSLSGDWSERPSQDGFDFVNDSLGEQVLVSVLDAKESLDGAQLREAVEQLVEIRRTSIDQLSGGSAMLTKTESFSISNGIGARFTGVDAGNKVQLAVEVHGFPHRVVTLSFYRYALDDSDGFRSRIESVTRSLAVSGT